MVVMMFVFCCSFFFFVGGGGARGLGGFVLGFFLGGGVMVSGFHLFL